MSQTAASTKYLFVFRYPENEPDPSPEEMQRVFAKWRVWIQDMKARGVYLAGDPLEKAPAKVLRHPHGKSSDGPFAEAKEVVAGYVLIAAETLEAATAIAEGCPALTLPGRSVEVRQIRPMPM